MTDLAFKGLWSHKRRLASTFLAVLLGVSFLTGTLVLSDTVRNTFSDLLENANAGTDAVVQPHQADAVSDTAHVLLDEAVVGKVRAVGGVARVEPVVHGLGQLVAADGTAIGGNGPPTAAGNWIDDPGLNPYRLVDGRAPATDHEVVINRGAATQGNLRVGDTVTVLTPQPVPATIVGLATFGDADSEGGMTFAGFTLAGAQANVLHQAGKLTSIAVAASPGVSQTDLVERIRPVLPNGVDAITGAQHTEDQKQAINHEFLDLFSTFLLVFAGIALLVATFSIYNAFSIIVAQRGRESALLRALGATRRQVLTSTLFEVTVIGVVASVTGLFAGLGLAVLLKDGFAALGASLPASGLTLTTRTIVITLLVGTITTVLAGVVPSWRSSRVAPMAALRDVAIDSTSASLVRKIVGVVMTGAGIALVLNGTNGGPNGDGILIRVAGGSALTFIGVVVLGPAVAALASRVMGWPLAHLRGTTGRLARENAARNPRRTSGTAAALMIGVGVVTLFTVFGASISSSIQTSVNRSFGGDLVVSTLAPGGDGTGFSPTVATDVAALPAVRTAVGIGTADITLAGDHEGVAIADTTALTQVLDLGATTGSLADLTAGQIAVPKKTADDRHWALGQSLPVAFRDGTSSEVSIGAIYSDADVIGNTIMTRAGWGTHGVQDLDAAVLVKLRDGVALDAGKAQIREVTTRYAGTQVRTRDEYVESVAAGVNQSLAIIYVMLVLAILIALMGIANTLSLSIHERTRELGLLRAVGQTRRQVRSMIRGESVIIALFGTLGGVGLGVFLGWALVRAAASEGLGTFNPATTPLLIVFVVGAFAGVLAAMRPARKAARLDVLQAIATD